MGLARTARDIQETAKRLAKQRAHECKLRAHMYEMQAKKAESRLGEAELDIGRTSLAVRRSGCFAYPSPAVAMARYGNACKSKSSRISHFMTNIQLASRSYSRNRARRDLTVHLD